MTLNSKQMKPTFSMISSVRLNGLVVLILAAASSFAVASFQLTIVDLRRASE